MITADQKAMLAIMGTDTLREYRDAIIEIIAERNESVAPITVVRSNVFLWLTHRPHLGREGDPDKYTTLLQVILHPAENDTFGGVMLNRETTRDHLWLEARWL